MYKKLNYLLILFLFASSINGYEIIATDPFEDLVLAKVCPQLNLSEEECILLLDRFQNISTVINATTIVNNVTVENNTIWINETKTIVVNQTKIIDNTTPQSVLDHEYRMAALNINNKSNIDLSEYYKKSEIDERLSQLSSDLNPPIITGNASSSLSSDFDASTILLIIAVLGIIGFLIYNKVKSQNELQKPNTEPPQYVKALMQEIQRKKPEKIEVKAPKHAEPVYKPEEGIFGDEEDSRAI